MLSIIFLRPEHVVLRDGSNGQPWRGEGDEPSLPFPAWVLLGVCIGVFFFCVLNNLCQITITRWRHRAGERREKEKWDRWMTSSAFVRWLRVHHGAVLARQSSIGSIVLALLFVPVSGISHPTMGDRHNRNISPTQKSLLELTFFVAGILSIVKAVYAFWFGYIFVITEEKKAIIDEEEPEHVKKGDQQPLLDCPVSTDWRLGDEKHSNFLTQMFRRMGLAVLGLEFLSIAFLVGNLVVLEKEVHTFKVDEGSVWLFGLYWITNVIWGCAQYLDMGFRRLDGLLGVVSVCPTMILLHMATKHRALEVAGRQAVEPGWLQSLFLASAILVYVEFMLVLFTPAMKIWKAPRVTSGISHPLVDRKREQEENELQGDLAQSIRIGYVLTRTVLRIVLNGTIGGIILGLFWMTREQCEFKSS
jgi:hypothetical protein